MQVCKYHTHTKCKECTATYHVQCDKFKKAHLAFLGQEITPFLFKKVTMQRGVLVSKDIHVAKSAALITAAHKNAKVKKLNFNQVISLCLANEEYEAQVLYLECLNKLTGDVEKITNVIKSFIDKMTLSGTKVIIHVAPAVAINFQEYTRI